MKTSAARWLAFALTFGVTAVACGHEVKGPSGSSSASGAPVDPGPPAPPTPGFDKSALLAAFADCALGVYNEANAKTAALDDAVGAWAAAPNDTAAREEARGAYLEAMRVWQIAEVFQFGPLGMSSTPGGQELRDPIYSWPLFARCAIEDYLVQKSYEGSSFVRISGVNARGLLAAELLLFYEGTDNLCPANNPMNAQGKWAEIVPELNARRAAYTKVITADLRKRIGDLVTLWGEGGANFAKDFKDAGRGSAIYRSDQDAFNAVNLSLFYLEREVKDMKLAWPANVNAHCTEPTCPSALESQYAGVSRDYLVQNLEGFRKLMVSCNADADGLGFDDYLRASGKPELAARMTQNIDASMATLRAIDDASLRAALTDGRVRGVYDAVKTITDDLKTEFVSVLNLELPQEIQGDND